jgi:hypothetical protein
MDIVQEFWKRICEGLLCSSLSAKVVSSHLHGFLSTLKLDRSTSKTCLSFLLVAAVGSIDISGTSMLDKLKHPVRLLLSARLISRGTVFFSHNKIATAGL